MKNLLNFKWLLLDNYEKQSPQRLGRYAAMLIMLLTLGVGQMWGWTVFFVNKDNKSEIKIYYWGGTSPASPEWDARPSMISAGTVSINGSSKSLYSYDIGNNTSIKITWSDGDSGDQTGLNSKRPYYYDGGWYMSVNAINIEQFGSKTNVNGGYIYFDNSNAQWSDTYRQFVVGRSNKDRTDANSYRRCYSFTTTNMAGTNLLYLDFTSASNHYWDDAEYVQILGHKSDFGDGNKALSDVALWADHYSDAIPQYSTTYTRTYLITKADGSNGGPITMTVDNNDGYNFLNRNHNIHVMLSTDNGTTYTDITNGTWKGTLTCTHTYMSNNGVATTVSNQTLSPASSITKKAAITSIFTLTESATEIGYTFLGYGTSSSATPDEATTFTISKVADATDIYAFFRANQYNGTIDKNTGDADKTYTATYGVASISIASAPTKTGCYVTGYYDAASGGNLVADADGTLHANVSGFTDVNGKWNATSATKIYPHWDNHYTVTLNDHDATVHGNTSVTATYGSAMPNISVPSKTGYIFGGYYTGEGGSGTKYYNENGTSARNWDRTSDTELHAKWTGITYQVAFDANEGTGTMANQDFTYGAAATALTTNTYTRSGYYFLGWNTQPDGSGTKYHDGKSVQNLTTTAGGIVTLYAQWAKTYTLYFLNIKTTGWHNVDDNQSATNRYAYAYLSYDEYEMYPLGEWTTSPRSQGTAMTVSSSITLPNVGSSPTTWCWSIDGVPEGATIIFSDNTGDTYKTGNLSGWTPSKPYYCKGNDTWYGLDGENSISQVTNMSVHIGEGDFASWKYVGIDKHGNGSEDQYAIIWLNKDQTYQFKYSNWYDGGESGSPDDNAYIIKGDETKADYGGTWTLNGAKNVLVKTNSHATGEYKFVLTWTGGTPQTKVYVPRGVNLTSTSPTQALAGEPVTVSFRADAWTNLSSGTDMNNPTYYFEFSTDNTNWRTVATYSEPSSMQANTSYTFEAQSGYFRVKLVNDHGLASYSGSTAFTAYSTKSFYVFNPYNNSSDKWETLHLYTWDSNNGITTYNGSFPGNDASSCINGNAIVSKGGDWFYITIDERANCFMLVGDETYNAHQTVTCYVNNYVADGKYMIYTESNQNKVVEYQAKGASDYRLKYTYGSPAEYRYSPIYNTVLDGTEVTASMWMDASSGTSLVIQQGTGNNTWADKVTYTNSSNGFAGLVDSDHSTKGYVFQMTLNFNTGTPTSSTVSDVAVYEGPYYVRTDALDGGWNVYKKADHVMTYTDVASAYDYYLCKWVGSAGTNVKFTVGNDYNPELVASLEGDEVLNGDQKLPQAANVRFAWNSSTNVLSRAYISGSSNAADRFLVLEGDSKMYNENGTALTSAAGGQVTGLGEYEMNFADDLNWIYEANVKAQPCARIKLTAKYSGKTQYFYGAEGDRTTETTDLLLGGSGTNLYKMRIVYDFKTNRLIKAFMPEGDITDPLAISADMMIIREHQGTADQITFDDDGALSSVQTVYGAMKFNKSTINDASKSRYERDLFWISFPFDVKLSEAFGFGEYGKHWIIEYYDGKGRAANGFWADSPSNWKFVMPADRKNFTMKAFEGYILALDLDEMTESSAVWDNGVENVYVYFPSDGAVGSISATSRRVFIDQRGYECKIGPRFAEGDDRRVKDSYWHCIGVPSFANYSTAVYDAETGGTEINWKTSMPYLYEWDYVYNTLSVTSNARFQFKATHSYLVQYSGDSIYWSAVNVTPASVAARLAETEDREYKLVLQSDERTEDQTFIRLTDDANVTPEFEFNYDLSKEMNKNRGNIYTLISSTIDSIPSIIEAAANVQPKPLQTTLVPVGVKVVANGEYTLAMPEGTNGEDVYLIDNAYGTRTNLGLMPYTVTLTAGTYEGRFALEFAPIQETATGVENDGLSRSDELNDANDDVRKVFVGGQLYIIRDGKVYDAAGQRIE